MKLARVGSKGDEIPVIIGPNGAAHSLENVINDVAGFNLSPEVLDTIRQLDISELPEVTCSERYGPCVGSVSQIICVGLNYRDHAKESGMELPSEPILFMKSPSAICGPNDNIILPPKSQKVDWEVELGVVIGSACSYVDQRDAQSYIAGYCVINDISERGFQLEGTGQWMKGKSADTFAPIGPWLVTQDEVEDVGDLGIWLKVNDELLQTSNTNQMVFSIDYLVSYISQYMTLQPGDVISTGTPFGVGLGLSPPRYLKPGDHMELGIDKLGVQKQRAVNWSSKF